MTERQWVRLAELCGLALSRLDPNDIYYADLRQVQSYARTNALGMSLNSSGRRKPLTTQEPAPNLPAMSEHQTQAEVLPPPPHLWTEEPTPENQIANATDLPTTETPRVQAGENEPVQELE